MRIDEKVMVVIPAYNEASTIVDVVERTLTVVADVLVVDDGSQDNTADLVARLPAILLRHPENKGKAASLVTGCREALQRGASSVITLDGDGQHRPEDIPKLLARAREQPNSIIIGSRRAGRADAPALNYRLNRIADFWISWASGYYIEDSQSGFRLFPRVVLEEVQADHSKRRGFAFESEILINAARAGYRSSAVPIPSLYKGVLQRSTHFRPVADVSSIVIMVAQKLLPRWMYPRGFLQYLREKREQR